VPHEMRGKDDAAGAAADDDDRGREGAAQAEGLVQVRLGSDIVMLRSPQA
jgi:hypothetical protein